MMKKMLKQNKGFSLIELLVAILIMAVIAGTAIMLFGGVLSSSRESADEETAENIKRAILTYINMTNDVNLSCLGVTDSESGSEKSENIIQKLSCTIKIGDSDNDGKVTFTVPKNVDIDQPDAIEKTKIEASDIKGTVGPFLDASKEMTPKTPGKKGWQIVIDQNAQVVTVEAADDEDHCKVYIDTVP